MSGACAQPKRAREVLDLAIDHGWAAIWAPGSDTQGAPYVSVRGQRGDESFAATWHTRGTGTYRMFSVIIGTGAKAHDATLRGLAKYIEGADDE